MNGYLKKPNLKFLFVTLVLVANNGCVSTSDPTVPNHVSQANDPEQDNVSKQDQMDEKADSEHSRTEIESSFSRLSPVVTNEAIARGGDLYQEHCVSCHGELGDGKGEVGKNLSPKPLNFTKGIFKFRSTPSGELPLDKDLFRTITVGIPGTSMDGYRELSKSDRQDLVVYLKSLSPRFLTKKQGSGISYPKVRPLTKSGVNRGRQIYQQMRCAVCHGERARGNGPLATDLTDTAGLPIRPADLTSTRLKSGSTPKDIYRTIMTGLDGTPMPSYGDSLDSEEGWDLALYVFSLAQPRD